MRDEKEERKKQARSNKQTHRYHIFSNSHHILIDACAYFGPSVGKRVCLEPQCVALELQSAVG